MALSLHRISKMAKRMLADYDQHQPNRLFAQSGMDRLTLADAYAVQRAVRELRAARGERCLGYKLGCVSPAIQQQLGLSEPVRGYLWQDEMHRSGGRLAHSAFTNLAIEGELALRLRRAIPTNAARSAELLEFIEGWFPVIELHNFVFRGVRPTSQELVAGNAMHAGFVVPPPGEEPGLAGRNPGSHEQLTQAIIEVRVDGQLAETSSAAELPGGTLGSVRWLACSLASAGETLKAGDIVLTGSPGRLIPIGSGSVVTVKSVGILVEIVFGKEKPRANSGALEKAQEKGGEQHERSNFS